MSHPPYAFSGKLDLLCMSNGSMHGMGFLEHGLSWIEAQMGRGKNIAFVPFAGGDHAAYTARAKAALAPLEMRVTMINGAEIDDYDGIVVGGGNSFRLLDHLQRSGLLEVIQKRVHAGLPYAGASAGAIITGQTIMTTNDMPIVTPRSMTSFGFLPFQINAHYLDPDPHSTHMGETRAERLAEYHEENDTPVIGLREGAALRLKNSHLEILGEPGAKIFLKGAEPFEAGTNIMADLSRK